MSSKGTTPGFLMVVSAPSATGKTTVVDRLVERCPGLARSRSYTSRAARPGEQDGVDYNFVSRQDFEQRVGRGEFLEFAEVFGHLYGTRRADTETRLATGDDVVLVIDVQGARQVRERVKDVVTVFVLPPSYEALEMRLRGRSLDPDGAIARRLATARLEVAAVQDYDYVVVNDDLDRCVQELAAIVTAERARSARRQATWVAIVGTFDRSSAGKD